MKRKTLIAVFASIGLATFVWKDRRYKDKIIKSFENIKQKLTYRSNDDEIERLVEKGGNPDPYDIEDNKMVSEGAVTSVNYYNKNAKS